MKILVSGATGFIGRHLTKRLLNEGFTLCAVVRPATNQNLLVQGITPHIFDNNIDSLVTFMENEKFDGVIHLASHILTQHKPSDIGTLIDANIHFSTALLEASVRSKTPWFINTGTFWQHYKNKKYSPVNFYAASKQAFEMIAQYYIETSPINFVTLKLSDNFGPNDSRPKIFNLWLKISKTGEKLDMSPGKQRINISYIDDVTNGYLKMIHTLSKDKNHKLQGKIYNLSSPAVMTLKELALIFEKVSGKKLNINWGALDYRPREVMTPWTKGELIPGWKPTVSLEKGIREVFKRNS